MLANLKGIFAPQAVAQSLKTLPPLESTIMDRYFKSRATHPLSMLGITDLKAVVQTVPVVRRDGVPVALDNEEMETQFFAPLPIKVKVPVFASELNDLRVLLGNTASLDAWRTRKVDQIRQAVHDTTEGMCAGVLTTGRLSWPVQLPGGRSEIYGLDYGAPLSHELAAKLTASSKLSDVYRLLRAMQRKIGMAQAALFQDVAREWWERYMLRGNLEYAEESWRRLEREVMPKLADKPLKKITAPMVLTILRRMEKRGTLVVARKVKSHISQIMR